MPTKRSKKRSAWREGMARDLERNRATGRRKPKEAIHMAPWLQEISVNPRPRRKKKALTAKVKRDAYNCLAAWRVLQAIKGKPRRKIHRNPCPWNGPGGSAPVYGDTVPF